MAMIRERLIDAVGALLEQVTTQVTSLVPWGDGGREGERRARVILDEMYQFVGLLDVEGRVLEANETALAAGGITRAAVIGKPLWEAHWWSASPEAQARLRAAIARAKAGEFVRYEVDVFGAAGGTELVTIDFSLKPVRDRAGRVVFLLPEGRNVTDKKRAEAEVGRKSEELRRLHDRLQELDRVKTQLFANVSHELRTPLALILGPTRKLLASESSSEAARTDLETIERHVCALLKHVNDLLDVARLEAGQMTSERVPTDLTRLVRRTVSLFEGVARERRVELAVVAPAALAAAVDPAQIERVLLNLLSNAFKFVSEGGRVRVELHVRGARVTLAVVDDGPGVPVEMRPAIFERLREGDDRTSRGFGGTGLGLSLARELVELHGGTLRVGEAPDGGALFRVDLPGVVCVRPEEVAAAAGDGAPRTVLDELAQETVAELRRRGEPADASGTGGQRGLVLVVEDDPEMSRFVVEVLAPDYQVAIAGDGRDGLEKALTLRPDLILSEVTMPELGGDELVRAVRAHAELEGTPIVLLTARADDELRVRLLREGAQDYVTKPFAVEELRARVANLIGVKRARDVLQRELATREQDIASLADELGRRQRELAAANRAKDEFMAILSHELRTPISAVLAWMWILRRGQLEGPAAARALDTMETDLRALVRMIDDLLDVSRIVRGNLRLDAEPVEIRPLVEASIEAMRPGAEARRVHLETTLGPQVGLVHGDPARLQQVVWNLLTNAIKFTPPEGVVRVHLARVDDEVRVTVSDTGVGIPADLLPHVFERFRQGDASPTRAYGGLGLGLAIVRHLVELHGGTVEAASAGEDRGAIFTVALPALASAPAAAAVANALAPAEKGEVAPEGPRLDGVCVLAVDDEVSAREPLALLLASAGAEVRTAASAAEGYAILTTWRPHVLVSDVAMPGEDGYALLGRVRALPADEGGSTPALALTAYARREDRARALAAGFQQHLAKPFDPPALVAAVAVLAGPPESRSVPVAAPPLLIGIEGRGPAAEEAGVGRGRTILLVEDDPGTSEYGCGVLEECGYRVIPARTAKEALRVWAAHRDEIDLVLTDLMVPRGSGMDVCRRVHEERAHVPVIVLSGYPLVAEMMEARRVGVLECLQKPVEPAQLAASVGRALRLAPAR